MNNIWYRLILFSWLLMLIFAPFAGFAPLLLVILISGFCWFLSPLAKILILGDTEPENRDRDGGIVNN